MVRILHEDGKIDMKLCSIASGSSGNCIFVGSGQTNLLVDAGISAKKIEYGLKRIDINLDTIQGVLVTHEHIDHVAGIGVLARRYNIPIYTTYETAVEICKMKSLGEIPAELFHYVEPDKSFTINDIYIEPFSTSHDAANPVCYTMKADSEKIGIATDLGKYDEYILSKLKDSDVLMIEANHDINMLLVGKYPYFLKQRILGDKGHLSNDTSADLISKLISKKKQHIILAHLSKENNYEELAYETVLCELTRTGLCSQEFSLSVAHRDVPSDLVII